MINIAVEVVEALELCALYGTIVCYEVVVSNNIVFAGILPSLLEGVSKLDGKVSLDDNFVCANLWDVLDGQVVCRELGYPYLLHVKEAEKNDSVTTGFSDFMCSGDETSLSSCPHLETNQTCRHKLAAVECSLAERGYNLSVK